MTDTPLIERLEMFAEMLRIFGPDVTCLPAPPEVGE